MIDIGCGKGGMIAIGQKLGLDSYGLDGDDTGIENPRLIIHDFTKGKPNIDIKCDLAYSTEFLEHIDQAYTDNYMTLFAECKYAFITAAPPQWTGHHHVNCQTHEYWIKIFNQYGFVHDPYMTKMCREKSDMNLHRIKQKQFVKMRALFFAKAELYDPTHLNLIENAYYIVYYSQALHNTLKDSS